MPGQLDLLTRSGLDLRAEAGRSEPRLWVRRLVIWSEPGTVLREITLRPGLNVVWSPDPADRAGTSESNNALGHGSGKTLFCRLLRYCLGEDRFAPDDQRYGIAQAFPEGVVGAEVVVDGTEWAVLRPIGTGRQHFAIPGVGLDQAVAGSFASTGMEPFLQAVETNILSPDVVALIPGDHPLHAWQIALAWLTRDQECRFDKVLDWRSPDSDSGSPARGLSTTKILDALRALIGAIVPEEYKLRAEIGDLETRQKDASQEATQRAWEAGRLRSRLIEELGLNPDDLLPGRLAVEPLRNAAKASLARLAAVDAAGADVADLDTLRLAAAEAQQAVEGLANNLAAVEARIPEIEALILRIKGELPSISIDVDKSVIPLCPICDVPIDRALAEGCKLSHKLPNLEEATQRQTQRKQDLATEEFRLQENKAERKRVSAALIPARKHAEDLSQRLRAAEKARDDRSDAWYKTRRLIDDAGRLDNLLATQEQVQSSADMLDGEMETKRAQTGAFRDAQAGVFGRLSYFFDAIIREMIGQNAAGKVALDGNGLKLSVEFGGDRSTAAIDSLKVIAFDLAVMCMSIEGGTRLPAFLVHDSPREADLGLSVYHRLFHLVRNLEQGEGESLFQYIVTTTTRPPDEVLDQPWLRDKLGGSPAEARLLRRDL
jgi:hypothetical protein